MELYGQKSKSIPQKIVIHIIEIFFLWLSYWILFSHGGDVVQNLTGIHNSNGGSTRRIIIFIFNIIIFLRIAFTMFYLLKRKIPWSESFDVPFAFALYYVGFSLFVLPVSTPPGLPGFIAILIFIVGCSLNTAGEILRDNWKKNPENKGKLYTKGLFKYSMHINYFGDLLWVTAYAVITGNIYSIAIPIFLFCFFAFYNIPKLDKYLFEKYNNQFIEYHKNTKRFIPFVY
jgi:protein-S-isoprenylcysteine O-methyltransferase Ste14